MQIELFEASGTDSFSGSPELHVRCLSNHLVDLARVRAALTDEQRQVWAGYSSQPHYYFPGDPTKESHGYPYDDEWHFAKLETI